MKRLSKLSNIDLILIQTMIICFLSFLQFTADAIAGQYYMAVFQVLTNCFICLVIIRIVDELSKDNKKEINDNENKEIEDKEHEENN